MSSYNNVYSFRCPACRKFLFEYDSVVSGKIVQKCPRCNVEYLDPRYFEPAIDGIPKGTFSKIPGVCATVIGLFLFLFSSFSSAGLFMELMNFTKQESTTDIFQYMIDISLLPRLVFPIIGICFIALGVIDIIKILTH